jgi:hypothetical protein
VRLWRVEAGMWRSEVNRTRDWFALEYQRTPCHCIIVTVSRFYLSWLGHECWALHLKGLSRYHRILGYLEHRKDRQKDRSKFEAALVKLAEIIDKDSYEGSANVTGTKLEVEDACHLFQDK